MLEERRLREAAEEEKRKRLHEVFAKSTAKPPEKEKNVLGKRKKPAPANAAGGVDTHSQGADVDMDQPA